MQASSLSFCYWSIAIGADDVESMNRCVQSARAKGVFTPFHVLASEPLADCECYDATDVPMEETARPLICLKAAISRLSFDHFIWVSPNTIFQGLPRDLIQTLGAAPLHVPLSASSRGRNDEVDSEQALVSLMSRMGVPGQPLWGSASFWIIQREAIELVTKTAIQFWHEAREITPNPPLDTVLAYTMQLFCANPDRHQWQARPDLWQPEEAAFQLPINAKPPALTPSSRSVPRRKPII